MNKRFFVNKNVENYTYPFKMDYSLAQKNKK